LVSLSISKDNEWRDLMHFKRSFTEPVPKQREEQFSKAGIIAFHGRARFIGERTVTVDDTHRLKGRHILYFSMRVMEEVMFLITTKAKSCGINSKFEA
jgi:pyruvate/2-oxoglutarate dehydrogenase complex dihydrolipoamide dehydrogenase (E3) component